MNGIHDMGGMHGFGPVKREQNEPVFHAPWEGRVFGMILAVLPRGFFPRQGGHRFALENLDPALYLGSSYYQRWARTLEKAAIEKGLVTVEEMDARTEFFRQHPEAGPARREEPEKVSGMLQWIHTRQPSPKDTGVTPSFAVGDWVRARNINPPGHTRLPRYVRGKRGTIARIHGPQSFQDSLPEGVEARPQTVYNVCFDTRELWGDAAESQEHLYVDMWESYLEPA